MKNNLKSLLFAALSFLMISSVSVSINKKPENINAAYNNEEVRIYLDKTHIIGGLEWWQTDLTYMHIWDGVNDLTYTMTGVSNTLFYADVAANRLNNVRNNSGTGFRMYVYDRKSNQNQLGWVDKTRFVEMLDKEFNLVYIDSINGSAVQTAIFKNKEVEETKTGIAGLSCSSNTSSVNTVVNQYNALRAQGKVDLNTATIVSGTTYYDRLMYFVGFFGANVPVERQSMVSPYRNDSDLTATIIIGVIGLTTLVGYYFLTKKQQKV